MEYTVTGHPGGPSKPGSRLLDLANDGLGVAGFGDLRRLRGQRKRIVAATLRGGDVDQTHHVGGNARHEPDLTPHPHRLLESLPRLLQPSGGVRREAQVSESVGHRERVAGQPRELQRPL